MVQRQNMSIQKDTHADGRWSVINQPPSSVIIYHLIKKMKSLNTTSRYHPTTKWRADTISMFCLPVRACHHYAYLQGAGILWRSFLFIPEGVSKTCWVFVIMIEMLQIAVTMQGLAFDIPTSSN